MSAIYWFLLPESLGHPSAEIFWVFHLQKDVSIGEMSPVFLDEPDEGVEAVKDPPCIRFDVEPVADHDHIFSRGG
jgi:hypothetical protein